MYGRRQHKNPQAEVEQFRRRAALGFVAYSTYDLTNQATLRGWPLTITLVDIAWGTIASGLAATISYLALSRWLSG